MCESDFAAMVYADYVKDALETTEWLQLNPVLEPEPDVFAWLCANKP